MTFHQNPYRRNAFEAFGLDRRETNIKAIRRALAKGRGDWKDNGGTVVARDGTKWTLTEAQMNSLEEVLLDPLQRLRIEEVVHQAHLFAHDEATRALAGEIAASLQRQGVPETLLDRLRDELVLRLARLLPEPSPARIEDDLPWPDPPSPLPVPFESMSTTILRER